MVNGECTNNCPDGQFFSGSACLNCNPKCMTCKGSATTCTSCAQGLSSGGDCVEKCPDRQYASVGFCANCDVSCSSCQQNAFNCIECSGGYIRSGVNCIKSCGQGLYYDSASQTCKSCANGCQTCLSNSQCTQCFDPALSPVNGVCQRVCPPGANLVGSVCTCSIGYLHQSSCISTCPIGFYPALDRTCVMCASPCYACSGSPTSCVSCISGYTFNPTTKQCT